MPSTRKQPQARNARLDPTQGLRPNEAREFLERTFRRRRRKLGWVAPSLVAVWALAAAYYLLMPAAYTSKWTLIVPVSNNTSNVSLDQIGQTSTQQSHTFGSVTLSPKVIYKEIADSEQVREAAAQIIGVEPGRFGRARVKLIDETSLMLFQMSGRSPDEAQAKARALVTAFNRQLDSLRRDETEKRSASLKDNLKQYQENLDAARERMTEFQRVSGLRSPNQYNEMVTSAELIRRKISDQRSELERQISNQAVLVNRIGLRPLEAAAGLKLAANPSFAKLATAVAEANAVVHENGMLYGPNHPALATARIKIDGAMLEIRRLAQGTGVDPTVDLRSLVMLINGSQQAELLKSVVSNESTLAGKRQEIDALESELKRTDQEISRLSADAAKLDNLKKDHLVAEAVLTSAVARLDTNKSDLFTSYPIVQVLAAPDLPADRSQPQLIIALAAGIFGSFFIMLAWGALWARKTFGLAPSKSA